MSEIEKIPNVSGGKPTIKGILTVVLCARFIGGESVSSIAMDYGLMEKEVEKAIRYEVLESTKKFEAELEKLRAS